MVMEISVFRSGCASWGMQNLVTTVSMLNGSIVLMDSTFLLKLVRFCFGCLQPGTMIDRLLSMEFVLLSVSFSKADHLLCFNVICNYRF